MSAAGGFGVVQPISLTHLYDHDFREGLKLIKSLTDKPFGVNFTILENKKYKKQMDEWMHVAADEGVKFFLTSAAPRETFAEKGCGGAAETCVAAPPLRRVSRRRRGDTGRGGAAATCIAGLPSARVAAPPLIRFVAPRWRRVAAPPR